MGVVMENDPLVVMCNARTPRGRFFLSYQLPS
jgi:hypothetical protein